MIVVGVWCRKRSLILLDGVIQVTCKAKDNQDFFLQLLVDIKL
ncbi:hypothetical protein N175_03470 [Vibrio anguillarum M3]|nr:hypothetical protein N175_03470 [Vibrio anguillarum M3]